MYRDLIWGLVLIFIGCLLSVLLFTGCIEVDDEYRDGFQYLDPVEEHDAGVDGGTDGTD